MCWDLHPHLELWNILLQNYFGRELFLWRNALSPFQLAPFLIGLSNPDARHVLLGFTESLAVSGSATEEGPASKMERIGSRPPVLRSVAPGRGCVVAISVGHQAALMTYV
jgi:hypothetical protein